ncbi:MAG: SMEK domain-containing protein [Terriglobales bacterium]
MTVAQALDKISKALALLALQTETENLAGLFSKNRLAEDLLLPVFQHVLSLPSLQNANQQTLNFPDIDLVDNDARVAIQVTTERKAAKVTETLKTFTKRRSQHRCRRLIFFILTSHKLNYSTKTKKEWQAICKGKLDFLPNRDVITTLGLFPLIQGLQNGKIYAVYDIIAQSVVGEAYVDVEGSLARLSRRQLESEKASGKYIPDIFIETRDTKNLARSFAHPVLFSRRTVSSFRFLSIPFWNRYLGKAGLPPLPIPDLEPLKCEPTLGGVGTQAIELISNLSTLQGVLTKYEKLDRGQPPFQIRDVGKHFYEKNTWVLQMGLGWSLNHRVSDLADELRAESSRILILTGRAGQGKTNLVCDFVENFLFKHNIGCAYLTGRLLRSMHNLDLGDALQRLLFNGQTASFAQAAQIMSAYAGRANKPVLMIIDGINEHHRIAEFSEQLEGLIQSAIEYPNLNWLLTCRSEFFHQRFGNLTSGPLKKHILLIEANEDRLEPESYEEMLRGYFNFFEVQTDKVSEDAAESLKKDMLFLRFFCEAYGARGKPDGYEQPFIANIYREDIFKIYLEQKLGTANIFLQRFTGNASALNPKAALIKVLEHCAEHMLNTREFANVPMSSVPSNLDSALYALLDEEIVLRRDAAPDAPIFGLSQEMINFTFDEFRDFLLAQYLLNNVYRTNKDKFQEHIAADPRDSQVIEGLKKFLFYASRHAANTQFWDFYRHQPWYSDVYDREVFNIDPKLLRDEDRTLVSGAMETGGERAQGLARHLAIRWRTQSYPFLNLDLLLSFVAQSDNARFDNLISAAFKTYSYSSNRVSATSFCEFLDEHILPKFEPAYSALTHPLFRFLVLLLPVNAQADLNSESYRVFRGILNVQPAYGRSLLEESLRYKPTRHRPYVWRLLASVSEGIPDTSPLLAQAETDLAKSTGTDFVLHREVSRFLDKCGSHAGAS